MSIGSPHLVQGLLYPDPFLPTYGANQTNIDL